MGKRTDFLYMSEPDTIEAGVLDARRCVQVAEEVFALLSRGDYLMGGSNHNSHGMGIVFPKQPPFPNMPTSGPDRRFVAMPAYLGGRFDVCGNKWYGSNAANPEKGLPRSVLTLILNDKDTGEPLCFMSANLISAARTGAVPGAAVRHLANQDASVITVIGCGPINRACFEAIAYQLPNLKEAVCYDMFADKAQQFADWSTENFGIKGRAAASLEEAVRAGQVITVAASRLKPLEFRGEWVQAGATVLLSGSARGDDGFWLNSDIVYDNIKLHEAYVEEAVASGDKQEYYNGVIGGPIYRLIDDGKLPALEKSISLGDIVLGEAKGRRTADQRILFVACGMSVFDVAWGYELYQTALEKGIGQRLTLWDSPRQA
ncbi:MAG: ornithine cyclodeaminase [Oscillospiraceae bacterium]|jgi:ornithine cyclodeaminase|nr:ornithine cyclodeaminase [Oscillospiraceae bacterium]